MDINQIILLISTLAAIIFVIYLIVQHLRRKKAGEDIEQEEFKEGMRQAQVIDVREPNEFNDGHILGARNIPYTQLEYRTAELRKDKPIYLYENGMTLANRASLLLKNEGYKNIYRLKGGYNDWDGRIKTRK